MANKEITEGYADVKLGDDFIIYCNWHGYITGALVKKTLEEIQSLADKQTDLNKPRLAFMDIRDATQESSDAREISKHFYGIRLDKTAVFGKKNLITLVARYLARTNPTKNATSFFTNKNSAMAWLTNQPQKKIFTPAKLQIFLALILIAGGFLTLIAWKFKVIPPIPNINVAKIKILNPIAAINFILIGYAMILTAALSEKSKVRLWGISIIGIWLIIFGTLTSINKLFDINVGVDTWLFSNKLDFVNNAGRTIPSLAIDFVFIGILFWLVDRLNKKRLNIFKIIMGLSVADIIWQVINYVSDNSGLQSVSKGQPIVPQDGSLISLLAIISLLITVYKASDFPTIKWLVVDHWKSIAIFISILFITILAWQQVVIGEETSTNSLAGSTQAIFANSVLRYLDAQTSDLNGYQGFFKANDFVSAKAFDSYSTTKKGQKDLNSYESLYFVRNVTAADKATFLTSLKQQADYIPAYKSLSIFPADSLSTVFPITYAFPHDQQTKFGLDLGNQPGYREAIESARDTGKVAVSDLLNASDLFQNQNEDKDFILVAPVYNPKMPSPQNPAVRRDQIYGFIVATFRSTDLFENLQNQASPDRNAAFSITSISEEGKKLIFRSTSLGPPSEGRHIENTFTYAGQTWSKYKEHEIILIDGKIWKIKIFTNQKFGFAGTTLQSKSVLILVAGVLLAIITARFFEQQVRRQEESLALAEKITEDLNTERNQALAQKEKTDIILNSLGEGMILISPQGKIERLNAAASKMLGYKPDEILHKPLTKTIKAIDEKGVSIAPSLRKTTTAKILKKDFNYVRKDGSNFPAQISIAPIVSNGVHIGSVEIFRDATKEHALDKAKNEFVSLVAHQMRTPLTVISWNSEILKGEDAGKLNERQKKNLNEIASANSRMIDLINDLLDLSRVELGTMIIEVEPLNLVQSAQDIIQALEPLANQKQIVIAQNYDPELPATLSYDPKIVHIIVENLIDNAIRYTPRKGHISINIRKQPQNIAIEIKDDGYGIPKKDIDKIFTKLFRADNARKVEAHGNGLGLYIVKSVVDYAGGKIWFESTEGKGTTFFVILPLAM